MVDIIRLKARYKGKVYQQKIDMLHKKSGADADYGCQRFAMKKTRKE